MKKFRNLKIAQKLTAAFLAVALVAGAMGVFGIFSLVQIRQSDSSLYSQNTVGLKYCGAAGVNFQQLRYHILKLTYITDASGADAILKDVEQFRSATEAELENIKTLDISADVDKLVAEIEDGWSSYTSFLDKAIGEIEKGDVSTAKKTILDNMVSIGNALRDDFLELFNMVSGEAAEKAQSNAVLSQVSITVMAAAVVVVVAAALALGAALARMIGAPLLKVAKVAEMLSAGDLNVNAVLTERDIALTRQKDEIGMLALAFQRLISTTKAQAETLQRVAGGDLTADVEVRSESDVLGKALSSLVESLNQIVQSIALAAEQVASGASLVSNSSMALSQGATEQASSVEQLTASIQQISAQVTANAQNAEKASELVKNAKERAAAGNEQMKAMLRAIEMINASSSNIGKIIKVIDDIAFQTNILALNAAVEAARAGQHGKGFAVVAEEVRTLASRSANAAKETTDLIEESIRNVGEGTKIAQGTAEALGTIVSEVEKVADLVGAIASASAEQALALEQVNQGVIQISNVVQTNAATSEESAAASEELSGQASQLHETVSLFKTKGQSEKKKPTAPAGAISSASARQSATPKASVRPAAPRISLGEADMGKY